MMRWEKMTSYDAAFSRPRGLRVPGEAFYREVLRRYQPDRECVIPKAHAGTSFFLFKVYSSYVIRRQVSAELWESYRLYKDMMIARYIKHPEAEDPFEKLLVLFWRAQRIMNPAAVKPYGKEVDDLEAGLEAMKPIFENPTGLKIQPVD